MIVVGVGTGLGFWFRMHLCALIKPVSHSRARAGSRESQDGCAPSLFVLGRTPKDIVSGNAALAIRRTSERNQRPLARDAITHFDGITDGPNVRVARLEMFVDVEAAEFSDFQTGVFSQSHFWFHVFHVCPLDGRFVLRSYGALLMVFFPGGGRALEKREHGDGRGCQHRACARGIGCAMG